MRKRKIVVIFSFMAITLSFYGAYKAFDAYRENVCENESLLLKNVEALASGTNAEGGLVIAHWCSRKPGPVLCTKKKGNRKWAREITFSFGYAPTTCFDCEDGDYEFVED